MRTKKNPEIPMVPKAHLKNVEHQRDEYKKRAENAYEKEKMLDKIIDIIKTGRNLGDDSDNEIILRAIEHELEYLGSNDEK
ncbi:hypothetical protein QI193_02755 [Staphylococcus saprophyticus]|nr:hypothetical protein [Staphylococcus saprophyticus]